MPLATKQRLIIKADRDNLSQVRDFIQESAGTAGVDADGIGDLLIAVDEAVTNTIIHGCKSGDGCIAIEIDNQPEALVVRIVDNCSLFDPTQNTDPDLMASPLDREEAGGFGVYLLKRLVDEISYKATEDGRNELTLLKRYS